MPACTDTSAVKRIRRSRAHPSPIVPECADHLFVRNWLRYCRKESVQKRQNHHNAASARLPPGQISTRITTPRQLRIRTALVTTSSVTMFTAFPTPGSAPAARPRSPRFRLSMTGATRFRMICKPTTAARSVLRPQEIAVFRNSAIFPSISSLDREFTSCRRMYRLDAGRMTVTRSHWISHTRIRTPS